MNIMRPKNPIFIIITLLCPWRLIHTFIILEDDKITLNRYCAINERQFRKKIDEITLGDIQKIGFSSELKLERQESLQYGAYGTYSPQEIAIITKSKIIALNAKPYTRKQIRYLMKFIHCKNKNVLMGKLLTQAVDYNYAK